MEWWGGCSISWLVTGCLTACSVHPTATRLHQEAPPHALVPRLEVLQRSGVGSLEGEDEASPLHVPSQDPTMTKTLPTNELATKQLTNLYGEAPNALAPRFEILQRAGVGRLKGEDGQDPVWFHRQAAVANAGRDVRREGKHGDLPASQGLDLRAVKRWSNTQGMVKIAQVYLAVANAG